MYRLISGAFESKKQTVCTILCFSASQIFEESYVKEGSKYFHTYANKVFGGWDMCIEDEAAGKLQRMRIVIEIEVRLIPSLLNYNFLKGNAVQIYC